MTLKIMLTVIIIFLSIQFTYSDKLYNDKKTGFSFNYPDDIQITSDYKYSDSKNIFIRIYIRELHIIDNDKKNNENEIGPDFSLADIQIKEDTLNKNPMGAIDYSPSICGEIQFIKINDNYSRVYNLYSRYSSDDITFERTLLFYINNILVRIIISKDEIKNELLSSIPQCFIKVNNFDQWNFSNVNINEIKKNVTINKMYQIMDMIINTLQTTPKTYEVLIDNLRLRESFQRIQKLSEI